MYTNTIQYNTQIKLNEIKSKTQKIFIIINYLFIKILSYRCYITYITQYLSIKKEKIIFVNVRSKFY